MGRHAQELEAERTYELVKKEKEESNDCMKSFLRFLFSQVGLVLVVVGVAVGGAILFIGLESSNEQILFGQKKDIAIQIENSKEYLSATFWNYVHDTDTYNYSYNEFQTKVGENLDDYILYVVGAIGDYRYDGTVDGWVVWWTFPKALLFTITIMTTVGYGYTYPVTIAGQMFTLVYTVVAVGSNFTMLTQIGDFFADVLTYTYSRICCRWFRSRRVVVEIPSLRMRKRLRRRLVDEDVGDEDFMSTNTIPIPIIVNVVIMFSYIAFGAFMFASWEGWDIPSSAYFGFITLLTIGFGDYVPINCFTGVSKPDATTTDYFKLIFAIFYCTIGVALISMNVSLIQEQAARSAQLAMGLQKEVIEMDVVVVTKRRLSFQESYVKPEEELEVVTVEPMVAPEVESPLPGVPDAESDEDSDEDDDEEEEEEKKEEDENEESDEGEGTLI